MDAISAFHRSIRDVPKHPLLDANTTVFGGAHRHCRGDKPKAIHPLLQPYVNRLYKLREPVPDLPMQLIHGDLNRENILVAANLCSGFIDMTPFWTPVDFALAMFANWIGPRKNNPHALRYFEHLPHFKQLLVRSGIRMLLIMTNLAGWESPSEKRAAEIILNYVQE